MSDSHNPGRSRPWSSRDTLVVIAMIVVSLAVGLAALSEWALSPPLAAGVAAVSLAAMLLLHLIARRLSGLGWRVSGVEKRVGVIEDTLAAELGEGAALSLDAAESEPRDPFTIADDLEDERPEDMNALGETPESDLAAAQRAARQALNSPAPEPMVAGSGYTPPDGLTDDRIEPDLSGPDGLGSSTLLEDTDPHSVREPLAEHEAPGTKADSLAQRIQQTGPEQLPQQPGEALFADHDAGHELEAHAEAEPASEQVPRALQAETVVAMPPPPPRPVVASAPPPPTIPAPSQRLQSEAAIAPNMAPSGDDGMADVIEQAIRSGNVELFLQPVATITDRSVAHFQVVPRLRTPSGALLVEEEFSATARQRGVLALVDQATLAKTVNVLRKLVAGARERLFLCTLSDAAVSGPRFLTEFAAFLKRSPDVAARLVLDLPDNALVAAQGQLAGGPLAELRSLGVRFAVRAPADLSQARKLGGSIGASFVRVRLGALMELGRTNSSSDVPRFISETRLFGLEPVVDGIDSEDLLGETVSYGVLLGTGDVFTEPKPLMGEMSTQQDAPAANVA